MTYKTPLLSSIKFKGSASGSQKQAVANQQFTALSNAISRHIKSEVVSFHTPGHKGRLYTNVLGKEQGQVDLTELPGLDDLTYPNGVLAELESDIANFWGAAHSFISTNGASNCLVAAMIAIASRGTHVLVPRNAHRSIMHGLILSGLFPVWYEPVWDDQWGLWGGISSTSIERLLSQNTKNLAGIVVVSPTYAGNLSDIESIAKVCHKVQLPLIVDEAHGAHFAFSGNKPNSLLPNSAVSLGADLVVHSLHKTLSALTQTGLIHVGKDALISASSVKAALNLLQSSSPSYLLLASIEGAMKEASETQLENLIYNSHAVIKIISKYPDFFAYQLRTNVDPFHILFSCLKCEQDELFNYLCYKGIFPETILGNGVLLLLGINTTENDILQLEQALDEFVQSFNIKSEQPENVDIMPSFAPDTLLAKRYPMPEQVVSPREAYFMQAEDVPVKLAIGRISAVNIAPCPPGTMLIACGQRVPPEILEIANLQKLRVIVE